MGKGKYTLKQLYDLLDEDLLNCTCNLERELWTTISMRSIRAHKDYRRDIKRY